ncbi:hypothetical protein TVAG_014230 [Trichomonas vaginalis G3]|uniref:TPR Domain containing protein n=1 Tax=Trichomonas vaginalis (strain ATCC PRA-98 / G3) TaxID=412133 RepID=A2DDH7_TRIV3|nr:hypothetical protein TVAGG3_0986020 [Trichomonas vaginalis G3]EAY21656.1 hypothetical protein TVAG_014230 [Trichomonas vaginalis G3]KAI5489669.1 hypothetical protein TVAGG3_0986020 [Trichomonas vaginalis G3]|eukprot:XP_001582642.1 hypothetical protein [Trichomonas vaginalis G3]
MSEQAAGEQNRRSGATTKQENVRPVPRRSAKEMDSACYRLSQSNPTKAPPLEKNESYVARYFKEHPDAEVDKTTPEEKLEGVSNQLSGDGEMEYKEKLELLVKQKALNFIVHGESSIELLKSLYQLGYHYHHNDRPASAIRHLTKAKQMEQSESIQESMKEEQDLAYNIDIECAESYYDNALLLLNQRDAKPRDISSKLHSAVSIASKIPQQDDFDKDFRVTILKARASSTNRKYQNASQFYENAITILKNQSENKSTEQIADVLVEHAQNEEKSVPPKQNTESSNDILSNEPQINTKAVCLYYEAFNMYQELGLTGKADNLRPKIPENIEEIVQGEKDKAEAEKLRKEAEEAERQQKEAEEAAKKQKAEEEEEKLEEADAPPAKTPSPAKTPEKVPTAKGSSKVQSPQTKSPSRTPKKQSPREEKKPSLSIGEAVKDKVDDIVDDDNADVKNDDDFESKADDDFESKEDDNNFEINDNAEEKADNDTKNDNDENFEVQNDEGNFEMNDDADVKQEDEGNQPPPENVYTPITTEENPKFKVDKQDDDADNFELEDEIAPPLPDMGGDVNEGGDFVMDDDKKDNADPDNELNFEDDFN